MKRLALTIGILFLSLLLAACGASPAPTALPSAPTALPAGTTELAAAATPVPTEEPAPTQAPPATASHTPAPTAAPTQTPTPPPTATPFPDYVLPGARSRYTFDQIVPLLSTPELLSLFMKNNVVWDPEWDQKVAGTNEYAPAQVVYERGADDCDGHATLQAYILKSHGYEAYNVAISIIGPLGHNVAGYRDKDDPSRFWSLNNSGEPAGPFTSWEALAQWYIDNGYAAPNGVLWLFDPFGITQVTTSEVPLLPHSVIR